jgi:hypothetical protein
MGAYETPSLISSIYGNGLDERPRIFDPEGSAPIPGLRICARFPSSAILWQLEILTRGDNGRGVFFPASTFPSSRKNADFAREIA